MALLSVPSMLNLQNPTPSLSLFLPSSSSSSSFSHNFTQSQNPFHLRKPFVASPPNSISSSFQFSSPNQHYSSNQEGDHGDDEEEEHVIGDCLVFEEGAFEDDPHVEPSLNSKLNGGFKSRGKSFNEVKPENLIPVEWTEIQEEINITKKQRRRLAQQLEYGKRLEKKRQGLRPIENGTVEEDYLKIREAKLKQLKPLVLDTPSFSNASKVQNNDVESEMGVVDFKEREEEDRSLSNRVAPRNPRLAVCSRTLEDISEFFKSEAYDPNASKKPEGPRKLFTKEEKAFLNMRIPDLAVATSAKWKPLHTLAASGEFYLVNTLLKHGADINVPDKNGLTAIHRAILGKKQAIFNYLLRESANPFVCDKEGATLMHYAVQTASSQMIKILLLYNVDINLPDNDGWTPLHLAVQSCRTDIVKLLLIKGADKTLKNQDGLTPLELCLYFGHDSRTYELIKLLKQFPKQKPIQEQT